MGNFAVATATDIVCSDNERLQDKIDNGTLGGDNSIITTEAEYLALPEEERLNNSYYLYDIGVHYKNGVAYSRKKPIQLTMDEYKTLGEVDPDQEYIVSADEQGILLEASDIGYSNAVSNLPCTTVQGAIDKIAETSGNVYSTEETKVGTWIDGKPIYRKCFILAGSINGSNYSSVGIIKPENFETLVLISTNSPVNNLYYFNTNMQMAYAENAIANVAGYVATLEYTKTTDA